MRISLVNTIRFYGGGEKRTLRAATEFRDRGHAVTVIGQPASELLSRSEAEALPLQAVGIRHYLSPSAILGTARALRASRAQAVVAYNEQAVRVLALAAPLAFPRGGVPILYYYGLEGSFKNKAFNRIVVAPRIARYIANAEAIRQELLSFGWIPEARTCVIYDGVDPRPIEQADATGVREELGVSPEDVVVLTVARLVPEKGHPILIRLAAELRKSHPSLRVWLAGEGPEAERLRHLIETLDVGGHVRMLGFRSDVPRLLRAADILCHPSRREGAPNAVREAMAAGLPVAAVAASGTPELIGHGETGFLAPIGDDAALGKHLAALLADPNLRERMGKAGRERSQSIFSEELCTDRWLALIQESIDESGGR